MVLLWFKFLDLVCFAGLATVWLELLLSWWVVWCIGVDVFGVAVVRCILV